jgi:hypothetical protein
MVGAKSICDRGIMMEALEGSKRVACLPLKYTPDPIGVEKYPITIGGNTTDE